MARVRKGRDRGFEKFACRFGCKEFFNYLMTGPKAEDQSTALLGKPVAHDGGVHLMHCHEWNE